MEAINFTLQRTSLNNPDDRTMIEVRFKKRIHEYASFR